VSIPVDPGVSAPTGDPDSLLAAASWHENLSGFFERTATTVAFTAGSLSGENWSGEAASSYQSLAGLVIGHFQRAATTASTAAEALRRYGNKLLQLQQEGVAAVKQVVHWMTIRDEDQKKLQQAQAAVRTAQAELSSAQAVANNYIPHGGPGAVASAVHAQAQRVSQAQTALLTAQAAERAAQKAVDRDDQQVLAWQTKARLIWHEAQNEAALATGSLEPLEVPPPPLAGAPATFTNTLADDAPFLAANPQLTAPFAKTIAAANANKNHVSSSDENNDIQTILSALNSGKNLNDVKLSVPHHSGGGLFKDILAGIAVGGTEIIGGGPEDPAADAASVAEVAAIEGTDATVEAATAGADATDAAIEADAAAADAQAASGSAGDLASGEDPLGYDSVQTGDGKSAIDHILDNHGPGTAKPWKGKFSDGTTAGDVKQMVNETIEKDPEGSPNAPDAAGNPREGRVYKADLGRTIGKTGKAGTPTSWVKVVVDGDGKIVTAYPIRPPQ
jgi:hypothetical protein